MPNKKQGRASARLRKGHIATIGLLVGASLIGTGSTAWHLLTSTSETRMAATTTAPVCPDAGACDADSQKYCAKEWSGVSIEASWKLDLVNCLYNKHRNEISATCLESLECRQTLNENLIAACKTDKKKFCAGITPVPGSEPLVSCLGSNYSALTTACAEAWTAHDAAKPE